MGFRPCTLAGLLTNRDEVNEDLGRLRVLQVIDTVGPGGAEDVVVALAEASRGAGDTCVVVVPSPGWIATALERKGIPVEFASSNGAFNLGYLRTLVGIVRRNRIDVIHAHFFSPGVYASLAGLLTGARVVVTFHGIVDVHPKERLIRIKSFLIARAGRVVAVSERLRDFLILRLGLRPGRVEVIANGIDTARFLDAVPADLHSEFGIPVGARIIGSVGNIRPAKAYEVGVRAIRALRDKGVDAHWLVAGQPDPAGELLPSIEREAERLGVRPYVHFLGFVQQPERFLAALECYLLCSSSEGHPLAVCQAMTSARPIVATRCGVEDALCEGVDAWIVPVGDAEAIASAIKEVLDDQEEARGRGAKARAHALASYDGARSAARYRNAYRAAGPSGR